MGGEESEWVGEETEWVGEESEWVERRLNGWRGE